MKGLRLIATGGALPGRTVTNEELSRTVDTSDEWITTRTGIRTRHQPGFCHPGRLYHCDLRLRRTRQCGYGRLACQSGRKQG